MGRPDKQQQEEIAKRRGEVMRMRAEGHSPAVIASTLGISEDLANQDVHRVLTKRRDELRQNADLLLADAVGRTEAVALAAWTLAREPHLKVSTSGKVVKDDDGQPVYDAAPALTALALVLRCEERLAKLLALDGAAKVEISQKLTVHQAMQVLDEELARVQTEIEAEREGRALPPADNRSALDLVRPNPGEADWR